MDIKKLISGEISWSEALDESSFNVTVTPEDKKRVKEIFKKETVPANRKYVVKDTHTKEIVSKPMDFQRAHRSADRRDTAYGGVRHVVVPHNEEKDDKCPDCYGHGDRYKEVRLGTNKRGVSKYRETKVSCETCKGTGKVSEAKWSDGSHMPAGGFDYSKTYYPAGEQHSHNKSAEHVARNHGFEPGYSNGAFVKGDHMVILDKDNWSYIHMRHGGNKSNQGMGHESLNKHLLSINTNEGFSETTTAGSVGAGAMANPFRTSTMDPDEMKFMKQRGNSKCPACNASIQRAGDGKVVKCPSCGIYSESKK